MSAGAPEDGDKSFEPTPQKLQKARDKGEVARSTDLSVAAAYAGLLIAAMAVGSGAVTRLGTALMILIGQPDRLAPLFFEGSAAGPAGGLMAAVGVALLPWFAVPAAAVLLSIIAQRAFVVTPSKLQPKLSRISLIVNAKNKFGRSGLFEFAKSFTKLVLYSICLGLFLKARLPETVAAINTNAAWSVALLGRLCLSFLFLVLLIAGGIGVIDAVWQHVEHRRKNMMTRKEIEDETKDAEGDPHMKQQRRMRGQEIAMNRMMADVPKADVVIVNPTHYAVALKWSRLPGAAPECVAKGVDETAAAIREAASAAGVPINRDPPTARALHATVEIGQEIPEELYAAVAASIRFAERMRQRAKGQV